MPRKPKGEVAVHGGSRAAYARGLAGVVIYVTPEEKAHLLHAAGIDGARLTHWVRDAALAAARRKIGKRD
jgi:uncharacterized protein (DUF1778 family)